MQQLVFYFRSGAQRAQFGGPGAQPRPKMVFPNAEEHLIMILIVVVVGAICV